MTASRTRAPSTVIRGLTITTAAFRLIAAGTGILEAAVPGFPGTNARRIQVKTAALVVTPGCDPDCFALSKRLRSLPAGTAEDISQGLAGNAHCIGCLALVHAFQIGKPQGFYLVRPEDNSPHPAPGNTGRNEQSYFWIK